jgi:hypothetical protein
LLVQAIGLCVSSTTRTALGLMSIATTVVAPAVPLPAQNAGAGSHLRHLFAAEVEPIYEAREEPTRDEDPRVENRGRHYKAESSNPRDDRGASLKKEMVR